MLASRLFKTVCLVLLGVLCLPARPAAGQGLRTGSIYPVRGNDGVAAFTLRISVSPGSPACGPVRPVILVNGLFQPTLYANVNDTIKVGTPSVHKSKVQVQPGSQRYSPTCHVCHVPSAFQFAYPCTHWLPSLQGPALILSETIGSSQSPCREASRHLAPGI